LVLKGNLHPESAESRKMDFASEYAASKSTRDRFRRRGGTRFTARTQFMLSIFGQAYPQFGETVTAEEVETFFASPTGPCLRSFTLALENATAYFHKSGDQFWEEVKTTAMETTRIVAPTMYIESEWTTLSLSGWRDAILGWFRGRRAKALRYTRQGKLTGADPELVKVQPAMLTLELPTIPPPPPPPAPPAIHGDLRNEISFEETDTGTAAAALLQLQVLHGHLDAEEKRIDASVWNPNGAEDAQLQELDDMINLL